MCKSSDGVGLRLDSSLYSKAERLMFSVRSGESNTFLSKFKPENIYLVELELLIRPLNCLFENKPWILQSTMQYMNDVGLFAFASLAFFQIDYKCIC